MTFIPDAAQIELAEAKREIRRSRRAFARSALGTFARAMEDAFPEYERMRREGVSREDACLGLEAIVRAHWPKQTSKFTPSCQNCEDTGYREMRCWDRQQCGREKCARNPQEEHNYVVPCECAAGDRMRRKFRGPDDDLASVGRMAKKKRGGFSRMGQ